MKRFATALLVFFVFASSQAAESDVNELLHNFCGTYFAPISFLPIWRMRTPSGGIREFEIKKGRGVSSDGWRATVKWNKAIVVSPRKPGENPITLEYDHGTLSSAKIGDKTFKIRYPNPVVYKNEKIMPLWDDVSETDISQMFSEIKLWRNDGRLKLFFRGPNQAATFVSFLLLVFAGLSMSAGRTSVRLAFASVASVFLVMLALTASRSGIVATAAGLAAEFACIGRARGWLTAKRILIGALVCMLALGGAMATFYISSRSAKGDAKSDATRTELWSAAPRMIHDAPWGWGGRISSGRAYVDWYSEGKRWTGRFNLISDHITALAAYGWIGGAAYLFCWIAGILLLLRFAWNGLSAIPAAVWISFATAASFNVVWADKALQFCAFSSLVFLLPGIRKVRLSHFAMPVASGAVVSMAIMASIVAFGCCCRGDGVSVHFDGKRVVLNGDDPKVFIVDDGEALGGASTPNEIRLSYKIGRSAEAVCYLKSIDDVTWGKVRRLVLAGAAGQEFIEKLDECDANADGTFPLPREIVFLSPQFPPSAIPVELRAKSDVRLVIGEFAARYWKEYVDPPKWVTIVRGAEVYIPGWMSYCVKWERMAVGS